MEDQWQAIRADILDIAGGDSMKWVRVITLRNYAFERGLLTDVGLVLGSTLEWALEQGLVEFRAAPPVLGMVRLTAAGTS
ncbi:hypothetical protein J2789_004310 [Variovorax paradoxus]|nr:hypothetical protein [Variovorax paradoxus]